MDRLRIGLLLMFCLVSSLNCGYTTSSALPSRFRTVHIEPFKNHINFTSERSRNVYFPLLEVDVRNKIIERFLFDGNLRIGEADQADLILKGDLTSYDRIGLRFTDNDDVEEYRSQITVNLVMEDVENKEILWKESGFVGEATFFVSGPRQKNEETAIQEATDDLARRIVERTIENW